MKHSGIPWIGEIPKEWELVPTKRIFKGKKKIVGDESDNYERLALTLNGVIKRNKDDNEGLQPEQFNGYQVLEQNELVFKLIDLQNIKTSRVGLSSYTGIVSPAYIILSNSEVDNRFYYYWFTDMYNRCIFNQMGDDGVRSALNVKDLLSVPIPYISENIRNNIASYLDRKCSEIDEMVVLQEKIIEELKAYKQSVITEVVTKGLNPDVPMKDSGIEWIGKIPESWEYDRLKHLFVLHRGYDLANEEFVNQGIPVYGSSGFMGYHNEIKVKAPNVIIGRSGSTGKLHYVEDDFWAHNTGIYISDSKGNIVKYLYYVLSSIDMDFLSTKTAVPTLDRKKIQEYSFVYTNDVEEQQSIASYLDEKCSEIDSLISIKQSKIESLKEYKKSIIYEYVTGKKEVE